MNFRLSIGKKQKKQNVHAQAVVEEEPTTMLQKLKSEEANLTEERNNLHELLTCLRLRKENLELKIREEIESKQKNIQKMSTEIRNLKFSCEELTKSLKTSAKVK